MLSKHLQAELERAKHRQNTYRPNESVCKQIADKTLTIIIAPAAMGKSYVLNAATLIDSGVVRVPSFTTRAPREDDDPGSLRYLPHDNEHVSLLLERIDRGGAVQYAVHPTENTIYGTDPSDYSKHYNMLPVLSDAVPAFRSLPFEKVRVAGLVAAPSDWLEWFNARFPEGHPKRAGRIHEAIGSLVWLLSQPPKSIAWLHNQRDNPGDAAAHLIDITKRGISPDPHARDLARLCLEIAKRL